MSTNVYLAGIAIGGLWLAAVTLAWLVVRTLGWQAVRRHVVAVAVLSLSLLAVPTAVLVKLALPYQDRIMARLRSTESTSVAFERGCSMFPSSNVWNVPISSLPVDPDSRRYIESIGPDVPLHADFSVPYNVVTQPLEPATVSFAEGAAESDPGPYRIPDNASIELGQDAHVLVLDQHECRLYELFAARHTGRQQWQAGSGAIFDLRSNRLRPLTWTSADAAGLPILPGLIRYDEVTSGAIRHALRFTARATRREIKWPARHFASQSTDPSLPPMGQRFRLRSSFDISGFAAETQVVLAALKEYGMLLADNGSSWYLTGAVDSRWPNRMLEDFKRVHGSDFEAVDTSSLMIDPDSAEARGQ